MNVLQVATPFLVAAIALLGVYLAPVRDKAPSAPAPAAGLNAAQGVTSTLELEGQALPALAEHLQWQWVASDGVIVFWTTPDETPGAAALEVVQQTHALLGKILPHAPNESFRVFVFPTTADLRFALARAEIAWEDYPAALQDGVIWVTAVNPRTALQDLGLSIPRQMVSKRMASLEPAQQRALPGWFRAGLPGLFEAQVDRRYDRLVSEAIDRRTLLPFAVLCGEFPADVEAYQLAVAQSSSLIAYVRDVHGEDGLARLADEYLAGSGCAEGASRALGRSLQQLEQEWLATLTGATTRPFLSSESAAWFVLLLLGLAVSALLFLPVSRGKP